MPKTARDILADALCLEPHQRAAIAAELLASLNRPAETARFAEVRRRIAEIASGGSVVGTRAIPNLKPSETS